MPVAGGAECADCTCSVASSTQTIRQPFVREFTDILRNRLGPPLLLGLAVAAVLMVLLPEDAIPRTIDGAGAFAFLIAALVGIPIYVCEGEEVALTYAALALGLPARTAFTFLLASVGTCVPTIIAAERLIGRRATALYVGAWLLFAIGAGVLFGAVSMRWP